jgi:hypothetical protein
MAKRDSIVNVTVQASKKQPSVSILGVPDLDISQGVKVDDPEADEWMVRVYDRQSRKYLAPATTHRRLKSALAMADRLATQFKIPVKWI